ncbi:MAG: DnaD domain protein [Clostridia bacterium]
MNVIEESKSFIFTDTAVSDIFITEHLSSLTGNQVKVYLYLLFLIRNMKKFTEEELSSVLDVPAGEIKEAIDVFLEKNLLMKKGKDLCLTDLKQQFITHHFVQRSVPLTDKDGGKRDAISSINKQFFQGLMGLTWYTDIELWFSQYKFDEDVMFSLFNHCAESGKLKRAYVSAVARNWYDAGIKNHFDLEKYSGEHKKLNDIFIQIAKKLQRKTPFTEYETGYIRKWLFEYGFGMDIIDLALSKTTKISNPNMEYVHKILTTWHKEGVRKVSQVDAPVPVGQDPEHFKTLRQNNGRLLEERKKNLFTEVPALKILNDEITELSIQAVSLGKTKKTLVIGQIREKEKAFNEILESRGLGPDYLEPIYTCRKCKDTGLLQNGKPCGCSKK